MSLKDKMFAAIQTQKSKIAKVAASASGLALMVGSAAAVNISPNDETANALIGWLVANAWLFIAAGVIIVVVFYMVRLLSKAVKGGKGRV
jgi:heme/copper-type cytochrome/quinol oxidase subunit 2